MPSTDKIKDRLEKLDLEKGLLFVRGAVPGPTNGQILVKKV